MWLAWSERIELYLGPGVALVRKRGTEQATPLFFPAETPVGDMLAKVSDVVSPWLQSRSWQAHVVLSGAWCPAVRYEATKAETGPQGHWQAAVEAVSRDMATEMEAAAPIDVRMDIGAGHIASGCPRALLRALEGWCCDGMERSGKLASVQPVWACATQAAQVRRHTGPVFIGDPATLTLLVPGVSAANGFAGARRYARQPALIDALTVARDAAEGGSGGQGGNGLLPAVMHAYAAASAVDLERALWMVLDTDALDGQGVRPGGVGRIQKPSGLPRFMTPYWKAGCA